jgi:DNA/RNA-binding domain of Phe-tRNA-synthetase-like protein
VKFGYDNEILKIAPGLVAGVIWTTQIANSEPCAAIDRQLDQATANVRERFPNNSAIARDPAIQGWREVYSRLGLTPNRYPCAAESLIRRAVSGEPIPRISPLVDLCNAVSLDHGIPAAPFDLRHTEGNVLVRRADGSEQFRAIGSRELHAIPEAEAVYSDDTTEVLSRRWNWRQTAKGAIQSDSVNVLITTEAVHNEARRTVASALTTLRDSIRAQLGGQIETDILSAEFPFSETTLFG